MVRKDFCPEKTATESEEGLYPLLHLYNSIEPAHCPGPTLAENKVTPKSLFPLSTPFPPSPLQSAPAPHPNIHQRGPQ